jgi:hypothetical protein
MPDQLPAAWRLPGMDGGEFPTQCNGTGWDRGAGRIPPGHSQAAVFARKVGEPGHEATEGRGPALAGVSGHDAIDT